ncbi:uncharacterized protein N7484_008318 [Penicillium longicatenatum]|uniref:uncharacterized protein n=1 Tax=Penicillium longicatenatum TaxID=1561947 RepID=UPI00254670D8|nr:uncharacterized protein N7484_008318 [Penicillium longicatenatum]KAJ5635005.1 hypothetical protein N7484_008318 [Penicillium longicatenatum]
MPKPAHEVVRGFFDKAINSLLSSMNLGDQLEQDGSTGIDVGGASREPDGQWVLNPVPAGSPSKPTMILEVGLSESMAELRRDAQMWTDPNRGGINIAMMLKVDRRRPKITIEMWTWDPVSVQAQCRRTVVICESQSGDKVTITGVPFKIPFDLLFRRNPTGRLGKDISLDRKMFEKLARRVWDCQDF